MNIYSDYDRSLDFHQFKSFKWRSHKPIKNRKLLDYDNDITEGNIGNYVNAELFKRGLSLNSSEPDLVLEYEITSEKKERQELVPQQNNSIRRPTVSRNSSGRGSSRTIMPSPSVTYKSVKVSYLETTLTIDIKTFNTEKLIWRGVATGEISNIHSFSNELPKDIEKMFKKLPIKKIRS
jgi:hypothetical protein